ncbi:MAG: PspC domain-containing protein [Paludibacteraceae bacterium]|nr:PspC domain-containing protein [Paludibacteraceae bacterium]
MEKKQLTRGADKMLAGVCSGIAEYFDLDPTLVRVCYAVLTIFTTCFPGLLLYLLLILIMPAAPQASAPSSNSQKSRKPEPEDVEYTNVKKED